MGAAVLEIDPLVSTSGAAVAGFTDGEVVPEYVDSETRGFVKVRTSADGTGVSTGSTAGKGSKGNRVAHIVLNIVLAALLALAAAVAVVPRVTGSVPLTVLTGSMTPTFQPGDLVVVRPTAVEKLHIGDVVTFQPQSGVATLVTHRIIMINHDAQGNVETIQTQGDANNAPDNLLIPDQIMGRVWYSVPMIGHLTNGRNTLLVISALGLGLVAYAVVLFTKKDVEEEAQND